MSDEKMVALVKRIGRVIEAQRAAAPKLPDDGLDWIRQLAAAHDVRRGCPKSPRRDTDAKDEQADQPATGAPAPVSEAFREQLAAIHRIAAAYPEVTRTKSPRRAPIRQHLR